MGGTDAHEHMMADSDYLCELPLMVMLLTRATAN